MDRSFFLSNLKNFAALSLTALAVGCGSEGDLAGGRGGEAEGVAATASVRVATVEQISPEDVVRQFLDQVRRGGASFSAHDLLTEKAKAELARIGQDLQPIGSPDAKFTVTRSSTVPGAANSTLVHSIWSESDAGETVEYQVVWALERETVGWRISGLAMEMSPGSPPLVMDFENGAALAQLIGDDQPVQR